MWILKSCSSCLTLSGALQANEALGEREKITKLAQRMSVGWLDTSSLLYLFKMTFPYWNGVRSWQCEGLNVGRCRRGEQQKPSPRGKRERERESNHKKKEKNWSDSRESKAVNEAEQVRCVDRFLSSLKKAKILTSEPLHLYSVAIYSAQIWTGELG